jgi:hypothetical protein
VDRDTAVDLLVLASVCQKHLLLIGVPGTAKTELVTAGARSQAAGTSRSQAAMSFMTWRVPNISHGGQSGAAMSFMTWRTRRSKLSPP